MGVGLPMSLSPSSVSAFKDCPLAFKFAYLDRLPQPPSPAATKGTLVHRALELLHERPADERTIDAALADLARARVEMADHPDFTELELTESEWEQFSAQAEELVHRYFRLEDPTKVQAIGLELKLAATIGKLTLRGIIDRLDLDENGEFVVTDYKTGAVPSEYFEQSRLGGVHIYALLCEKVFGRRPARVQLLYLSKPEAIIATPSEQSIKGVERKTGAIWSAVERACATGDFRPSPGKLCDYCTFKPYCPAFGGDPGLAAESLLTPA
jgi:putative RecB family exonuclease